MDENKEFLSAEAEDTKDDNNSAVQPEVATDTDARVETDEAGAFASELAELDDEDFAQEYAEKTNSKKKFPLQVPVIIAAVLVACVALAFLVFKCFFDTSIVGAWTMKNDEATADEASNEDNENLSYYVFDSENGCDFRIGTMTYSGTYTISADEDGNNTVNMSILALNLNATFNYEVSGNIFTGRKLELSYGDDVDPYEFVSAKLVVPEIKPDKDFKANDKIVGEWNYYDGMYDDTYTFNSDGMVKVNQSDMLIIDGTYTVTDDKITVKYYADDEYTTELSYTVDGDMMIINGMQYFRVGSASADEARNNAGSAINMMQ